MIKDFLYTVDEISKLLKTNKNFVYESIKEERKTMKTKIMATLRNREERVWKHY